MACITVESPSLQSKQGYQFCKPCLISQTEATKKNCFFFK